MPRRRGAEPAEPLAGLQAVILDAQAMSLLAEEDHHPRKRELLALLKAYDQAGYVKAISVVTLTEQRRSGAAQQRLRYWQSALIRVPVSESIAYRGADLLEATGLDGHECVVDALVVATAATAERPRVISSDNSHLPRLCKAASGRRSPIELRLI